MMKDKKGTVKKAVERLAAGEIEIPVEIKGTPEERSVLAALETMRQKTLETRNRALQTAEQNKLQAASVVHDLKTPLALISGYAQCMQDGIDEKDYLTLIIEKTADMNEMIHSLMDAAERESGQIKSRVMTVNARGFFKEVCTDLASLPQTKNIKYDVGTVPNVAVSIDKMELERVMQNFVSNAVRYTKKRGKIKVRFAVKKWSLRVCVKDNGTGIAKEDAAFVFDKFFMADKSRGTNNSGLGLYAVKQIVKAHGGRVWVKSKPKKGSAFYFTLPLAMDSANYKLFSTVRYERQPKWKKLLLQLFFGWAILFLYRIAKYRETRRRAVLYGLFLCIPFFPFIWITDMMSELLFNKISFE